MTPTKELTLAQKFYFDHAGFSYDAVTETPAEGRTRCAIAMAAAADRAQEEGYFFKWSVDPDGSSADCFDPDEDGGKNNNPWQVWQCLMQAPNGETVEAMGGVDFGRDCDPWMDAYRLVVEAELALQHFN
jgi:hypothetical protein